KLLVALANAQVQPPMDSPTAAASGASGDEPLDAWLTALRQAGAIQPEVLSVPVNTGAAIAAAQYTASRALVFLSTVDE
ncbi:hypothetical protein ABTE00_22305, partial [Acinetobacter baumannii]